jgi:hypothetical protein
MLYPKGDGYWLVATNHLTINSPLPRLFTRWHDKMTIQDIIRRAGWCKPKNSTHYQFPVTLVWYPRVLIIPDSDDEESVTLEELEERAEQEAKYGERVEVFTHKRKISEAIPSNERANDAARGNDDSEDDDSDRDDGEDDNGEDDNGEDDNGEDDNGEGNAARGNGASKVSEETPSVSRYGRTRKPNRRN